MGRSLGHDDLRWRPKREGKLFVPKTDHREQGRCVKRMKRPNDAFLDRKSVVRAN